MTRHLGAFLAVLVFWLLIPLPFWALGWGFAGEIVLWPSFEPDVALLSLLSVALFYGPLLLMAFIVADAVMSHRTRNAHKRSENAPD